ncbi:hypothetical protein Tco_0074929, partial [Tanacetum coccineum]
VEPPAEGQSSNAQAVQAMEAWKHSDFLCHNYVLNGLIDPLYNVYCKTTTAKELWESLERKYKTEDAGTKNTIMESRNASFFENIFPYLSKETGSSSRLDDKVVQDKRQRDDNDLQDERQDQTDEEEIYMNQPEGFIAPGQEGKV